MTYIAEDERVRAVARRLEFADEQLDVLARRSHEADALEVSDGLARGRLQALEQKDLHLLQLRLPEHDAHERHLLTPSTPVITSMAL